VQLILNQTFDWWEPKMYKIPLIKSTFPYENEVKNQLVQFILNAEKLSMGTECKQFEEAFSQFQGRKFTTMVNSGSSANLLLLQSLLNLGRIRKGDKIGFSAVTWSTNVMPIIQLGLCPIPIDIDLDTLNVDSEQLSSALVKHSDIKVLFITNLLGFCADLEKITEICDSANILLIEDNCESLGSELNNKKLGNFGVASTCSSFVGHHISTIEGGMVSTDDEELDDMFRMVRAHGWSRDLSPEKQKQLREKYSLDLFYEKYAFYFIGMNIRPTEISGFLGQQALKYIKPSIIKREINYLSTYRRFSSISNFHLPFNKSLNVTSCFAVPLIFKDKFKMKCFAQSLNEKGIENRPIVGGNIVNQPFFKDYTNNVTSDGLSVANLVHENGIYLPNHPDISEEDLQLIHEVIHEHSA